MNIYLAGPMRGIPQFNFPLFDRAAAALRRLGHTVFNPAEIARGFGFEPSGTMGDEPLETLGLNQRDLMSTELGGVMDCDAVAVLPGWAGSDGARAEVAVAWALGLPVWRVAHLVEAGGSTQGASPVTWGDLETQTFYDENRYLIPAGLDDPADGLAQAPRNDDHAVYVASPTGGVKGQKLERFDLLPVAALTAVARHYGLGCQKYPSPRNWEKGVNWSLNYAACQRHLNAFWAGEEIDNDPALPEPSLHLAAAAFHVFALLQYSLDRARYGRFDDRPSMREAA